MASRLLLLSRQHRRVSQHLSRPSNSLLHRSLSFTPWGLQQGALRLLEAFERFGHHEADLDPLGLTPIKDRPELDPLIYFPPDATLNTSLGPPSLPSSLPSSGTSSLPIGTVETYTHRLRSLFCIGVGFEYAHLDEGREREWLRERIHQLFLPPSSSVFSPAERVNAAALMMQAEAFEEFLAIKYPSFKRYSGEGAEAMQPCLDTIFREAARSNIRQIVIGMPHRGRLAFLVSQLNYPVRRLLYKIEGKTEMPADLDGIDDDVTSHLAASLNKEFLLSPFSSSSFSSSSSLPSSEEEGGREGGRASIHLSLLHNPSHLEIIGPVAVGKTHAKQADHHSVKEGGREGGREGKRKGAMCLQIHGDAALAGQGVNQETLLLSQLEGFEVGGSVHVVVNNQLGFTTHQREEGRSSLHCTDIAKSIQAPVFHVNGERIDDVMKVSKLAVEYREAFGKDVFIDLLCFRKHGHNEVDEPAFTNPVMYKAIRDPTRQSPAALYTAQLKDEGLLTDARVEKLRSLFSAHLSREHKASLSYDIELEANAPDFAKGKWRKMRLANREDRERRDATGAPAEVLRHIGLASVAAFPETPHLPPSPSSSSSSSTSSLPPSPPTIHPRLDKSFVQARLKMMETGKGIDWATAEALALGSLLAQGFDVRLCGQDVGRGTFSQRHFLLTDQETGERVCPLANVPGSTGRLEVINSPLSELAVLAFEYGVSLEDPMRLVLWEAQFADFANSAQLVIDTLISGSESKWLRQTGLVLLLPHGYDGAGPEHSSGRIERFLQLSNDHPLPPSLPPSSSPSPRPVNMHILNCTTPASYFHALRRQLLRPFRKPLVLMAPKTLLRHPRAVSSFSDLDMGTTFSPVLASTLDGKPWKEGGKGGGREGVIRTVIFCTGKVYYDLLKEGKGWRDVDPFSILLLRLEELSPFPSPFLRPFLPPSLPPSTSFFWVQEEPLNAGAYSFVAPHLLPLLPSHPSLPPSLEYIGRPALPTPAVGMGETHKAQTKEMFEKLWRRVREGGREGWQAGREE